MKRLTISALAVLLTASFCTATTSALAAHPLSTSIQNRSDNSAVGIAQNDPRVVILLRANRQGGLYNENRTETTNPDGTVTVRWDFTPKSGAGFWPFVAATVDMSTKTVISVIGI